MTQPLTTQPVDPPTPCVPAGFVPTLAGYGYLKTIDVGGA